MAAYLGKDLNEMEIEKLSTFVSFENMKNYVKFKNRDIKNVTKEYFRSGKIGIWKTILTVDMSKKIDDIMNFKLTYKNKSSIRFEPTKF